MVSRVIGSFLFSTSDFQNLAASPTVYVALEELLNIGGAAKVSHAFCSRNCFDVQALRLIGWPSVVG